MGVLRLSSNFAPLYAPKDLNSMLLTIDIGNTRAKFTLFDDEGQIAHSWHTVSGTDSFCHPTFLEELRVLSQQWNIDKCAYCSVRTEDASLDKTLKKLFREVLKITGTSKVPMEVDYQSRATLGADRLVAVVGALELYPNSDVLVIDAGTCITFDLLTAEPRYRGGNISPGIGMRLAALHQQTARLPLVDSTGDVPVVGYDTETAIRAGVVRGVCYEIEGYIRSLRSSYPNLQVLLTGGSAADICKYCTEPIITSTELVTHGLRRLMELHAQEQTNNKRPTSSL